MPSTTTTTAIATTSSSLSASSSNHNGGTTPSSSTTTTCCLKALLVSAYDLPIREPPLYVQIRVGTYTVKTGPPTQRHKDRNSFKFDTSQSLTLVNPDHTNGLASWYSETAIVELFYASHKPLKATYALNQLKIHEPTWLILTLDENDDKTKSDDRSTTTSSSSSLNDAIPPTIRLQLTLIGPYRAEVSALLGLLGLWFGLVERVEDTTHSTLTKLNVGRFVPSIDPKWLVVPAVPVAAIAIVTAPIVLGILTLGLPVFLPLMMVMGMILLGIGCLILVTWSSTTSGRRQIGGVVGPMAASVLQTPPVQQLVYATGPRPSPVTLARTVTPLGMHQKLLWSLIIDMIGSCSYLIPLAGEFTDVAWAPFQTVLIMAMYDHVAPNLKYLSIVEEILPLTDVIPSATLGWLTEFGVPLVMQVLGMATAGEGVGAAPSFFNPTNDVASASYKNNHKRPLTTMPTVPERTGVAE